MNDGTGLAEALLGLAGFKVLEVTEGENEFVIAIGTAASEAAARSRRWPLQPPYILK